jgi:hypothetical protein
VNAEPAAPQRTVWTRVALLWLCGVGAGLQFAKASVALLRMAFLSLLPGAIYPMIPLLCAGPAMQARTYGAIARMGNVGSSLGPRLFGASFAALAAFGLMAPALVLSACGVALTRLAARRFGTGRSARKSSPRD